MERKRGREKVGRVKETGKVLSILPMHEKK